GRTGRQSASRRAMRGALGGDRSDKCRNTEFRSVHLPGPAHGEGSWRSRDPMLGFQQHTLSRHSFVSLAPASLLRARPLEWLRSFLKPLVDHNFIFPHHRRALAEDANLLAKRANVKGEI